ncbi:MAG: enoyl-CoA hydratase/isomerase family protein [Actinomycetota bacterium]
MIRFTVGGDHVGRITLDRPDAANALTVEMRDEIVERVRECRDLDDVRSVLVTATG